MTTDPSVNPGEITGGRFESANISGALDAILKHNPGGAETIELDRLLLRVFENPSLIVRLCGVGKNERGQTELDFDSIPDEIVDSVKRIIGPIEIEVLKYNVDGRPHTGFRFNLASLCVEQ